jgi:MtN3 and saliva related transmembrane protein
VLTTLSWIPQVVRTWRTRPAGDLSLGMLSAFAAGVTLWLVYGVAIASAPVVIANVTTLILALLLIAMRIAFGTARARPSSPGRSK